MRNDSLTRTVEGRRARPATCSSRGREPRTRISWRPGSSGRVIPGYQARLVDDDAKLALARAEVPAVLLPGSAFFVGYPPPAQVAGVKQIVVCTPPSSGGSVGLYM